MTEDLFFNGIHIYIIHFFILAFSLLQLRLRKGRALSQRLEIFAVHLFGIGGFNGIVSFFMHTVYADKLAESIGCIAGNPFQTEVAVANLAIGIVGFAVFFRGDFMLPYVIAASIFSLGAGVTHIIDIMQSSNFAPGNAGPILYADFFAPLLRIGLYLAYARSMKPERIPASHARWYRKLSANPRYLSNFLT